MFTFSPMPHDEAVARTNGLPLLTRDVFDELLPELRAYAFTVSGLDTFDQLANVRSLIAAVPEGSMTWQKARKGIAAELVDNLGGKAAQRRAELLLRTHVFRGYAVSRYRTLMAQVDVFPFWQYKTVGDHRVRPSHAALNNKIFPAGHEIWQRIFPPWDWGCRCLVVPLLGETAQQYAADDAAKAPENQRVYDGSILAAIHGSGRLPSGHVLDHAPTWSASPWSVPGTVQHTWGLVQDRYKSDPQLLAAFTTWAESQVISPGLTVADWLSGRKPTKIKAVKAAKAAKAAKPAVVTAASIAKDLVAQAATKGLKLGVEMKGATVEQAQHFARSLQEHLTEFPEAMKAMAYYGTSAGQGAWLKANYESALKQAAAGMYSAWPDAERRRALWVSAQLRRAASKSSPGALAFHAPRTDGNRIVFGARISKPTTSEIESWDRARAKGWWPSNIAGKPHAKTVADHELGHLMDFAVGARRDPEIQKEFIELAKLSLAEQAAALSHYGSSMVSEMIAESWCEYRNAPQPRPLAVKVSKRLIELYQTKFPPAP